MENNVKNLQPVSLAAGEVSPASFISAGTKMVGTLGSKGDMDVAGIFQGDINCNGCLTLRNNMNGNVTASSLSLVNSKLTGDCVVEQSATLNAASKIEGNVTTNDLVCAGNIRGDIDAKGNVDFSSTSSIRGDVKAGSVTMERGSVIVGHLCIE